MALLTINGVEMPSPSKLEAEIFEIGAFGERTASGRLVADRVAVKRRLKLKWAVLSPAQMGLLLGAVGGVFFEAAYPDPQTGGMRTMTCRCADCSAGVLMIRNDQPVWTDVEMEWEER